MLALVASIHVLNTSSTSEDVDDRDKPDHDAIGASYPFAATAVISMA